MRGWSVRQWLVAVGAAGVAALLIGVPTAIVQTAWFTRMTPVLWWNYPVWVMSAVLTGLIAATYVGPVRPPADQQRKTVAAGVLTAFAVGCPICNKLVVLLLGVGGAMSYFAPVQPLIALVSLALLGEALRRRLRALRACPTYDAC